MSFETAVQTTLYTVLSNNAPLNAIVQGVYDDVDDDQEFPYVVIGESFHNEADTFDTFGDDVTVSIHSWSDSQTARGRKEVKEIQGAIYTALHRYSGIVAGYHIIAIDWQSSETLVDDGNTRHGVQNFRVLLDLEV